MTNTYMYRYGIYNYDDGDVIIMRVMDMAGIY